MTEQDKRLLEAAQDLLDACKLFVARIPAGGKSQYAGIRNRAVEAIAKAERELEAK